MFRMKRHLWILSRVCSLSAGATLLGLVSCATPFLERAKDPPGLSGGVAVAGTTTVLPGFMFDELGDRHIHTVAPHIFVRQTLGSRFSLGLEASCGLGLDDGWEGYGQRQYVRYAHYDVWLAGKCRISSNGALKLDARLSGEFVPLLRNSSVPCVELTYLHDFGELFTGSVRVGVPSLIGIGFNFHPALSRRLTFHAGASTANLCGAGAGLGLEWHQPSEKKWGQSPISARPVAACLPGNR